MKTRKLKSESKSKRVKAKDNTEIYKSVVNDNSETDTDEIITTYSQLENHYTPENAWQCRECGELVTTDYGIMIDHLSCHGIECDINE